MKLFHKIFKLGLMLVFSIIFFNQNFALAQSETPTSSSTVNADDLFQPFVYKECNNMDGPCTDPTTKISVVQNLPKGDWQTVLSQIIRLLLNITGSIALVTFTAGGVFMITANGDTDKLAKGKKVLIYSIIGLIIIAVSYALVLGVSELQIFTTA